MSATQTERLATALGRSYRLERELGVGGMATVFLAEDIKHDRKVAIKVLKPEPRMDSGATSPLLQCRSKAAPSSVPRTRSWCAACGAMKRATLQPSAG